MKILMRLIFTDNHCSKYFLKVILIFMINILITWRIKKLKSNYLFKNSVFIKEKIENKERLFKFKICLLNLLRRLARRLNMEPKLFSDMLSHRNIFAVYLRLLTLVRELSNYNSKLSFLPKSYSKFDHIELMNMKVIMFTTMTAFNFITKVQTVM